MKRVFFCLGYSYDLLVSLSSFFKNLIYFFPPLTSFFILNSSHRSDRFGDDLRVWGRDPRSTGWGMVLRGEGLGVRSVAWQSAAELWGHALFVTQGLGMTP